MSSGETRKVLITGIAGRLGRLVAQALHRDPSLRVAGLDRRPFSDRPADVTYHQVDLRSRKAREAFTGGDVHTLIHMGVMHAPHTQLSEHYSWNIEGTSRLLDYCLHYGVKKVVVLSSANVYGPRPENAQLLSEEAPLLAAQSFPGIRDLVEIDHLASSFFWKAREIETVILRPVHILGRVHNAPSNYLRLARVPTLLGFDPMVQIIHERDVVRALQAALTTGARGIYNIVGPGEVPLSVILNELGRKTLPVPAALARPLWGAAFKLGMSSFPEAEFDFIRYVCMVDGSRASRELGFSAQYSLRETIHAIEE